MIVILKYLCTAAVQSHLGKQKRVSLPFFSSENVQSARVPRRAAGSSQRRGNGFSGVQGGGRAYPPAQVVQGRQRDKGRRRVRPYGQP